MIYLGIDNGVTGGIAVLSPLGQIIDAFVMPVHRVRGNEIDAQRLVSGIRDAVHNCEFVAVVEECPEHSKQKSTMRSMATSYGIICGAISAAFPSMRLVRVRSGNPKDSWQRAMLNTVKGNTKPAALAKARSLWPSESWLATPRSSTPHSGLIDAALIAEYARTKQL